jgi:hypothetical protein
VRTDDFIDLLVQDPPPRWSFKSRFESATACGIVIAAAFFFLAVGLRRDILEVIASPGFLFKFVVTLLQAAGATGFALRMGEPGKSTDRWIWALATVPILLAAASVAEMALIPADGWLARLVGHSALRCLTLIPLMSVGPLICLLLALRHGAPARPGFAGAMAGLAASGIAAIFYAANCTDDSPLFVAAWFSLATLLVTAVGYLAGRNVLSW